MQNLQHMQRGLANIVKLGNELGIPSQFLNSQKRFEETSFLAKEYKHSKLEVVNYINSLQDSEEIFLYLILNLALDTRKAYKNQGIEDSIWTSSMSDVRIWQNEYEKIYKKAGILEAEWVLKTIDMELFKLGELQFEKIEIKNEVSLKRRLFKVGDFVLNTHIQKGADISPVKVEEAYMLARSFFNIDTFTCESWLLCQELKKMLPPNSNIINFQNRYEIVSQIKPHQQMIERIMETNVDRKRLPKRETSLQKALRIHLEKGGEVGLAKGYFYF